MRAKHPAGSRFTRSGSSSSRATHERDEEGKGKEEGERQGEKEEVKNEKKAKE